MTPEQQQQAEVNQFNDELYEKFLDGSTGEQESFMFDELTGLMVHVTQAESMPLTYFLVPGRWFPVWKDRVYQGSFMWTIDDEACSDDRPLVP